MATNKHSAKKKRLAKARKHLKWAPFWIIPKMAGVGKKIHPSAVTVKKRSWRRTKLKA